MNWETHEITAGAGPNEVYEAAENYLAAAALVYSRECEKEGRLAIAGWYVVHHLSVIAAELFVKSFKITIIHPPVRDESGPDEWSVEAAFKGHNIKLNNLKPEDHRDLEVHLSKDQFDLLNLMSDKVFATDEIMRGRYPYESFAESKTRFPPGELGKALAERWFDLARALSTFRLP